jgi:hypothetical protein
MRTRPLRSGGASRISSEGTLPERKLGLKQRLFDGVIKFLAIAFYLWVMFGVFGAPRVSGVSEGSFRVPFLRLRSRKCPYFGESDACR